MSPTRLPSEPFSNVDAAWLHMDEPTNMAMVSGVLTFDAPLDLQRLKDTLAHRLLPIKRFSQREGTSLQLSRPLSLTRHLTSIRTCTASRCPRRAMRSHFKSWPDLMSTPLISPSRVADAPVEIIRLALIVRLHLRDGPRSSGSSSIPTKTGRALA
jgi:hypothetical protein